MPANTHVHVALDCYRNTEILTFDAGKICRVEVYFGWDLD
jgi:hypothetical protein